MCVVLILYRLHLNVDAKYTQNCCKGVHFHLKVYILYDALDRYEQKKKFVNRQYKTRSVCSHAISVHEL